MKQILTVMKFEFRAFAKSGTFIGITVLMALVALVGPALPGIIQSFDGINIGAERRIAVVDHTGHFTDDILAENIATAASLFGDLATAREAMDAGDYNYVMEINAEGYTLHVSTMGIAVFNLQHQIFTMLQNQHRVTALEAFGLGAYDIYDVLWFHPAEEVITVTAGGDVADDAYGFLGNFAVSYVVNFLLYFGVLFVGQHLLTTVIREKSTKTMELLITSCKPAQMLNGKVLGVCSAVLLQLLLMVGAAVVSMQIGGMIFNNEAAFSLDISLNFLAFVVVFFLLGFFMFSYLYAALASTCSRMEDANSVAQIPMLVIIVGFAGAMIGMQNPGTAWFVALSFVPVSAPFVMLARVAMGTAATWEIAVSIAGQVATIILLAWLGAKIYRMGTLMYGNKPKLKDLVKAFR